MPFNRPDDKPNSSITALYRHASLGFADPEKSALHGVISGYLENVIRIEWPAQAKGLTVDRGSAYLRRLNDMAIGLQPAGVSGSNL